MPSTHVIDTTAEGDHASAAPVSGRAVPAWLTRTQVYRRLPLSVRGDLDEAILHRPAGCSTLEAVYEKFDLAKRYGVSLASLKTYAARLDRLVRPAAASQVVAAVLGCLPADHRDRLVAGTQVMLLSKVVHALTREEQEEEAAPLSIADLGRLAGVLRSVTAANRANTGARSDGKRRASKSGCEPDLPPGTDQDTLAEAVRMLYGLPWPLPARDTSGGGADLSRGREELRIEKGAPGREDGFQFR